MIGYVTDLPPGTYLVTYWYHVTLSIRGNAEAGAEVAEDNGETIAWQDSILGGGPVTRVDSGRTTRVVRVTVGASGEARVFRYSPAATTPQGASTK